jgi:transposase-like protein
MVSDSTQSAPIRTGTGRRNQLAEGLRRRYRLDFKLQVVTETLAPGASVSVVAQRNGMNTNVVFRWCKQFREGRLGNDRLTSDTCQGDARGCAGGAALGIFVQVEAHEPKTELPDYLLRMQEAGTRALEWQWRFRIA